LGKRNQPQQREEDEKREKKKLLRLSFGGDQRREYALIRTTMLGFRERKRPEAKERGGGKKERVLKATDEVAALSIRGKKDDQVRCSRKVKTSFFGGVRATQRGEKGESSPPIKQGEKKKLLPRIGQPDLGERVEKRETSLKEHLPYPKVVIPKKGGRLQEGTFYAE